LTPSRVHQIGFSFLPIIVILNRSICTYFFWAHSISFSTSDCACDAPRHRLIWYCFVHLTLCPSTPMTNMTHHQYANRARQTLDQSAAPAHEFSRQQRQQLHVEILENGAAPNVLADMIMVDTPGVFSDARGATSSESQYHLRRPTCADTKCATAMATHRKTSEHHSREQKRIGGNEFSERSIGHCGAQRCLSRNRPVHLPIRGSHSVTRRGTGASWRERQ
jgi:hypothetical protein